jgi:hypothetical protein
MKYPIPKLIGALKPICPYITLHHYYSHKQPSEREIYTSIQPKYQIANPQPQTLAPSLPSPPISTSLLQPYIPYLPLAAHPSLSFPHPYPKKTPPLHVHAILWGNPTHAALIGQFLFSIPTRAKKVHQSRRRIRTLI